MQASTVIALLLISTASAADTEKLDFTYPGMTNLELEITASDTSNNSTVRGLRFGQTPLEVIAILHRTFPSSSGIWWGGDSIELWYAPSIRAVLIRFDKNDRANKFEFTPAYFGVNGTHPKEFADAIFKHFEVGPIKQQDDVCFSQSTCFQGLSKAGELFLIFMITGELQLHVFAPKKVE